MATATKTDIYAHRVKDLMTKDVVTVGTQDSIGEALTLMSENRVSALPVVDSHNRCVGMLSTSDLVDMTRELDYDLSLMSVDDSGAFGILLARLSERSGEESVQSFMSDSVTAIGPETPIAVATREMLCNQIHHLPVVNDHGRLVGIVSSIDILAEFADGAPE